MRLREATIIWLRMLFSFLRSVSCSWKLLFSSFWLIIPSSRLRYSDSTRGVVVSVIYSLMFSILVRIEFSSCRNSSIILWYYCRSLSPSRAKFSLRKHLPPQGPSAQSHESSSVPLVPENRLACSFLAPNKINITPEDRPNLYHFSSLSPLILSRLNFQVEFLWKAYNRGLL